MLIPSTLSHIYQRLLSLTEMVFVSRATPTNPTPVVIFLSTEEASTQVETVGTFYSFFVPGRELTALVVQQGGIPQLPIPGVSQGLQIDTTTTSTTVGNTTVTRQVQDVLPESIVQYPNLMNQSPCASPIIVIVETEGGDRFHYYERDRWSRRRVERILIIDSTYLFERSFNNGFW